VDSGLSNPAVIGVISAVALIIVLTVAWVVVRNRRQNRTEELRARFGPEYELALRQYGSRAQAEAALLDRVHRINGMNIHRVSIAEREHFLTEWESIQGRFIDHPRGAVTEADELINTILAARGYDGEGFSRRIEDLSVNHAFLVETYRRASAVTVRAGQGEASMEELRSAMILYRAIIEELLQTDAAADQPRAA
jgi:hypothetical protein